jgi:hypothetical protein
MIDSSPVAARYYSMQSVGLGLLLGEPTTSIVGLMTGATSLLADHIQSFSATGVLYWLQGRC